MAAKILLGLLLTLALGADTVFADRPIECADEDKVSKGSRFDRQMCKWDLNLSEITHVELVIEEIEHQNAPYCQRVYRFFGVNYEPDFEPVVNNANIEGSIKTYDSESAIFAGRNRSLAPGTAQPWLIRLQTYGQGAQPGWGDWFNLTDDDLYYSDVSRDDYFYFSGGSDDFIDFRSRRIYPVSAIVSPEASTVEYTLMQLGSKSAALSPYYTDRFSPKIPTPPNFAKPESTEGHRWTA